MSEIKIELMEVNIHVLPNRGWGNGYVHIPSGHPSLVHIVDLEWCGYMQMPGFPEEITYSQWNDDKSYYIIGFDTCHSYNTSKDDEAYVRNSCEEIKTIIENFTAKDAKAYAEEMISIYSLKFKDYL
jgi:hypothetical protein